MNDENILTMNDEKIFKIGDSPMSKNTQLLVDFNEDIVAFAKDKDGNWYAYTNNVPKPDTKSWNCKKHSDYFTLEALDMSDYDNEDFGGKLSM